MFVTAKTKPVENAAVRDAVFESFLKAQWRAAQELAEKSDLLGVQALAGTPPNRYLAEFRCRGLACDAQGQVYQACCWHFMVFFPPDYLRKQVHVSQVLTYLGPEPQPFHPNLANPFICIHLEPGTELCRILFSIHELITWNLRSTADALNSAAAQWARNQPPGSFPVDRRPLVWRQTAPEEPGANRQEPT